VKFTGKGGSVVLAVTDDGFDEFMIAVTDTGIGMHPEQIPQALKEFGQIDNSLARHYEGTGLGLHIANRLIDLHGGRLQIDSVPGEGPPIIICLPRLRVRRESSAA
jgi:signal transduction histidine kinase